jgi:hypothetical protein
VTILPLIVSLLSLAISAAAFRYARMRHFAEYPYIEARRNNSNFRIAVYWTLKGPDAANWEVTTVHGRKGAALLKSEWKTDPAGHQSLVPVQPPETVQSIDRPASP